MHILIIGAGPTGLGAGWRLCELGHTDWAIYEKNDYVGGLSATHSDGKGFLWDEGGHVLFSRYSYFDRVVDEILRNEYLEHERHTWIHLLGTWVPYPFQNNLRFLPDAVLRECLEGLTQAQESSGKIPDNFEKWLLTTFGAGICKYFMFPHNRKLWTVPLDRLGTYWVEQSISIVKLDGVLANIAQERRDTDWGANRIFRYPLRGGTGELWRRLSEHLHDHLHLGKEVTAVNVKKRVIALADGTSRNYDVLINTMPLDRLMHMIHPPGGQASTASRELVHNNILVVGIGVNKPMDDDKSWVYFPEEKSPFYRVTYFSTYSPFNVPGGKIKDFSSFICEIAYTPGSKIDETTAFEESFTGLVDGGILAENDKKLVVSKFLKPVEYAYPVPTLDRNQVVETIQSFLEPNRIYSRGRFGTWKYESGSMDQCFMQGVEVVDQILPTGEG